MRFVLFLLVLIVSCSSDDRNTIEKALASDNQKITTVVDSIEQYEVQIKLSTISRNDNQITFENYEYRVDDSTYFYPASTVKFPVSVLVLEKLSQQDSISLDTPFYVEGDSSAVTFRQQIRDIFAVSSNDTYNRLFEFYGKDNINNRMEELELAPSRFSHRLSTSNAYELTTKPVIFQMDDTTLVSTNSIINKPIQPLELKKIRKGIGYYSNDVLIEEQMDFSEKNYLPITTIHELMKRIIFPEAFPKDKQFKLSEAHRTFLLEAMQIYPKDEGYESPEYYDGYGKFFLYGDTKEAIPEHIKIYNKVGYAYGYLTDCAYIVDSENDIEYILTATIHVNKDGIFNDDVYEYDTVGMPFLAQLGREIHAILSNN